MQMAAMTFRAEPDFFVALRAYADGLGVSVNTAIRDVVAPVIGVAKRMHTGAVPRNDLKRFCGVLKDVDCSELERVQEDFGSAAGFRFCGNSTDHRRRFR